MSEKKQKLGAGHAKGMMRQGAKEIAQVLPAFPAHGVQPIEEAGVFGNLTPQEVAQDKGAYETMLNGYAGRGPEQQNGRDVER
jgi:hypothetical protein